MTAGERSNLFQRGFITPAGKRRKLLAELEVFDGNGQPPGRRATAKELPGERQQRARVCGVRHQLRALGGFELAQPDIRGGIRGGIHEHHGARFGNWFREFGRELMAHKNGHAGQAQFVNRRGYLRPHAIIAAQRVAVANDQQDGAFRLGCVFAHATSLA